MATQDPGKDVPPADALENDRSGTGIMSPLRNDGGDRNDALVIDDLEEDEIKVLTAKPRDIRFTKPAAFHLISLSPNTVLAKVAETAIMVDRRLRHGAESLSACNRRHRRSPGSPQSLKRNIAFGVPAELTPAGLAPPRPSKDGGTAILRPAH